MVSSLKLSLLVIYLFSFQVFSQEIAEDNSDDEDEIEAIHETKSKNKYPKEVQEYLSQILKSFEAAKYKETVTQLSDLEKEMRIQNYKNDELRGLIAYWRAITYKRINEFPQALDNFRLAIKLNHDAKDIYYEYAQALYTSEEMGAAEAAFRTSAKLKKFKPAVSWYYVGFINQNEENYKQAIEAYKKVEEVDDPEKVSILQPAMMQLGDIYYLLSKQREYAVETIEKLVIPQYEKAMNLDPDSRLGFDIRVKIQEIRRVFDIVMFRLRNGRPAMYPPHFLRFTQGFTSDSNVTFIPDDTSNITSTEADSIVSNTSMMGRYTYYHRNYLSFSPELRITNDYHLLNRSESDIIANDNYAVNFALRNAYEYYVKKDKKRQARSIMFDYEYNYLARDIDSEESLKYYNSSHTMMIGRRFAYGQDGDELIVRYKFKNTTNTQEVLNSVTHTFAYEHVYGIGLGKTILFTGNLNLLRSDTSTYDTNALMLRFDLILPRFRDWFTPSFAYMATFTDTLEQADTRGTEITSNPSMRLTRSLSNNSRLNFSYSYTKNTSDSTDYTYTKTQYGFEYELVY